MTKKEAFQKRHEKNLDQAFLAVIILYTFGLNQRRIPNPVKLPR